VHGVVNPPGAVVIPEVMIRILRIDFYAEGSPGGFEGCCAHVDASPLVDASRCRHKKTAYTFLCGRLPAENFVRVRIFLSRTSEKDLGSFSSHRGFLQPRLADLHLAIKVLGMLITK